jgi:tRNA(Ile2) C34 agmatinyltransferase TiaS
MKKFVLLSNRCPACGEQMIPDKYDYYICVGCGGTFCPPADSKREVNRQILDAMAHNHIVSNPTMHVKGISSGSKSKSHKSTKAALQRPSTTKIYNILCAK